MPKSLRLIACLLAASPLVACGNDDATRAASANPAAPVAAAPVVTPTQANVDIVEKHLAAFNAHDRDGAGALLHDDVFYFDATYGDGQNGRDAAVDNTIGVMLDAMPDLEWQLRSDPVAAGDSVA